MIPRLVLLSEGALRALAEATAAAAPREMAGLLAGRSGDTVSVERFVPIATASCGAEHFAMSGQDFAAAEAAIRASGEQWLGFAHSHPRGRGVPSDRDRDELWRGCVQLVVAPGSDGSTEVSAFWLTNDGIDHLRVVRAGAVR